MTETLTLQTPLERRYRRLLACYPTEYRAEYGEEMIGVLLASTPADQDRPTKAAAFDLIGGGLRQWFRLLRTGDGDSPWRNTLAVFSVIAPVLAFVTVAGGYVLSIAFTTKLDALAYRYNHRFVELAIAGTIALAATVICPILARRGRAAVRIATAIAVVAIALAALVITFRLGLLGLINSWGSYLGLMLAIEIVALVLSPGPSRGWQLLGRKGLRLLIATAVVMAAATGFHLAGTVQRHVPGIPSLWNVGNFLDAVAPVVGVALIAVTLRWPAGGRLLALFAIPGYLLSGANAVSYVVSYIDPMYWRSRSLENGVEYLPVATIAVLIAVAAWRSSRRRRPRIPGATR
jgi:hypothetical protein